MIKKRDLVVDHITHDGRVVTIGADSGGDYGAWILHSNGLLRWLSADDAKNLAALLLQAAEHLIKHPKKKKP